MCGYGACSVCGRMASNEIAFIFTLASQNLASISVSGGCIGNSLDFADRNADTVKVVVKGFGKILETLVWKFSQLPLVPPAWIEIAKNSPNKPTITESTIGLLREKLEARRINRCRVC